MAIGTPHLLTDGMTTSRWTCEMEDHMYRDNPYIEMTPEMRAEIEQADLK